MSEQPESPRPSNRRRASIVELFSSRGGSANAVSTSPPSGVASSPNGPQHRRGASITAVGLNNSASGQTSPYDAFARQRRASFAASSGSGSPEFRNSFGDEPAVIEDDETSKSPTMNSSGSFARRVSFGAQALRDVRQGNGPGSPGAGRRPSSSLFTLNENNENNDPQRRTPSGTAKTGGKSRGLLLIASYRFFICGHVPEFRD